MSFLVFFDNWARVFSGNKARKTGQSLHIAISHRFAFLLQKFQKSAGDDRELFTAGVSHVPLASYRKPLNIKDGEFVATFFQCKSVRRQHGDAQSACNRLLDGLVADQLHPEINGKSAFPEEKLGGDTGAGT